MFLPDRRNILTRKGYKWLPKRHKRLYSKLVRLARAAFAKQILRMSNNDLREKLSMAMDGVVAALPPTDPSERMSFCRHGENRMWRKPCESFSPKLSGDTEYGNQVPLERVVPMRGGCSADGISVITFRAKKKLNAEEWAKAVTRGALVTAIKALKPVLVNGPWDVRCDNESFLRAAVSSAAHTNAKVMLWKILPSRWIQIQWSASSLGCGKNCGPWICRMLLRSGLCWARLLTRRAFALSVAANRHNVWPQTKRS